MHAGEQYAYDMLHIKTISFKMLKKLHTFNRNDEKWR